MTGMMEKSREKCIILSTKDVGRCLAVRRAVFVKEQNIPEETEIDELDSPSAVCDRFLIVSSGVDVGTFRCFFEDEKTVHLQRLCVLPDFRNRGLGRSALAFAEKYYAEKGAESITLNAQCKVMDFYLKCGYTPVTGVFSEADIPHIGMMKNLRSDPDPVPEDPAGA